MIGDNEPVKTSESSLTSPQYAGKPNERKRHNSSSSPHRNTWENLMVPIAKERVDETGFYSTYEVSMG